jgi:hypothetical protein
MPEQHTASVARQPAPGCGASGDNAPLKKSPSSLNPPLRLVERWPSYLVLQSGWNAALVTAGVFYILLTVACVTLAALGLYTLAGNWQGLLQAGRQDLALQAAFGFGALGVLGAALAVLLPRVCRYVLRGPRGSGPVHFDQDSGVLLFGPPSQQQTRPLGAVAALQLVPTKALGPGEGESVRDLPWPIRWLFWLVFRWLARCEVYQLNLVFSDGSRLHLADWGHLRSVRELVRQLAAFLKVPLLDESVPNQPLQM